MLRVKDVRTGNVIGPYTTEFDARLMAAMLNDFVLSNAGITTNPFKVIA